MENLVTGIGSAPAVASYSYRNSDVPVTIYVGKSHHWNWSRKDLSEDMHKVL